MAVKNPPHPRDFIPSKIIEPAGLSVTAAAAALQVSRPALASLLNAKADLSGDMALRIEKAFGVRMDTLTDTNAARLNLPRSLFSRTSTQRRAMNCHATIDLDHVCLGNIPRANVQTNFITSTSR